MLSWSLLHDVVIVPLNYWKVCAQWIRRILSEVHKKQRMSAALNFSERCDKNGNKILDRIVTGDET